MNESRPLDLSLRKLEYLVAIADRGSFGSAAAACGVSQPSLSSQVAQVEDRLGVVLFERSRPVRPTAAGARVIAQARLVLREARALEALGRSLADPFAGALTVAVIPTLAPYLLPRLHPALSRAFPKLTLRWSEMKTADLERAIAAGDLDVGLIADPPATEGLAHRVVGREPFVAVLAGAGATTTVGLADLGDTPILLLDDGHCLRGQTESLCSAHALAPSPFHATSLATLVQMVAAGLGTTLLPACAVAVETARADVRACPIREEVGRDLVLVWRRSDPRAPLIDPLGDTVRDAFADGSAP